MIHIPASRLINNLNHAGQHHIGQKNENRQVVTEHTNR